MRATVIAMTSTGSRYISRLTTMESTGCAFRPRLALTQWLAGSQAILKLSRAEDSGSEPFSQRP